MDQQDNSHTNLASSVNRKRVNPKKSCTNHGGGIR